VKPPKLVQRETFSLKNPFFQNFVKMKLSQKIGNSTSRDPETLYILFNESLWWGIMNLGHFWKIEFFTKTPIPPLTKFQNFEKIQITRNHEKLDGYCKLTPVFVSSIGKTSKTSTNRDFFQKNSFFLNFVKMKISPKILNLTTPDTEMLYIMINNSLIWKILNLGHLWKIEFFTKMPIPTPRRNSRNSKKFKLLEIMKNTTDIVN
jgi:hypothetical protein